MQIYDIVIIGAGPAGLTAALYARRADKTVLVIEKENFGGQITHSPKVENYPGFTQISGGALADQMAEQIMAQGADVELDAILDIRREENVFCVRGESGCWYGKSVIIASGSKHRTLGLPREEELTGNGVSYCAVCDGAFFAGKTVAVIGGGNSALQESILLAETSKEVVMVQNLPYLTGEKRLADYLKTRSNVRILLGSVVKELLGERRLEAIRLSGAHGEQILPVDGLFVAIGQSPENAPFSGVANLDENGYIAASENCETGTAGVYVAGDCRTKKIRQVTTAVADGAVAALAACRYLDALKMNELS